MGCLIYFLDFLNFPKIFLDFLFFIQKSELYVSLVFRYFGIWYTAVPKGWPPTFCFGGWAGNLADPVPTSLKVRRVCRVSGRLLQLRRTMNSRLPLRFATLTPQKKTILCLLMSCSSSPKSPFWLTIFLLKICCHAMEVVSAPWLKG